MNTRTIEDSLTPGDEALETRIAELEDERATLDERRRALGEEYRRTRPGPYRNSVDNAMRTTERELGELDTALRLSYAERRRRAHGEEVARVRAATVSADAAVSAFTNAVGRLERDFADGLDRCMSTGRTCLELGIDRSLIVDTATSAGFVADAVRRSLAGRPMVREDYGRSWIPQ